MASFLRFKTNSLMDDIRCDEPSYLIWKWHPTGSRQGGNKRENAIRWGSALRVKDGEVAVFVYSQQNGVLQDYIEGPYDGIIVTENLPVLSRIIGLAYNGGTPFQAEIYFINLAQIIQIKFGVPFFDVYDPRFLDFGVPVSVRGTISFQIDNYDAFIKLNRLRNFSLADFQKQIRDTVIRYVKEVVINTPAAYNIPVIQLESRSSQVNDVVEYNIKKRLKENFGVLVSGVDIGAIEIDKSSEGYRQLMAVTKDITATRVKAETEDYMEKLRIQRKEGQYAQHMQTQSANIDVFQVEKQTEVGIAGAAALRHMGSTGTGNVNSNGGGFNPAAMMTGMAIGSTIGQNIAETMNDMMAGINRRTVSSTVPPSAPAAMYHVAANGQASGPFDAAALSQMAAEGRFSPSSLVWKPGMLQWEKAETIDELRSILANVMPPIPPIK